MMNFNIFSRKQSGRDAFEALLMPHLPNLYRLAYRYCGQQSDAEDLVQDMLVKLYPRMDELEKVEKLRPWLAKTLYRMFIDNIRRHQRSPFDACEPEQLEQASGRDEGADNLVRVSNIEQALAGLNEDQRILVVMHDIENYTLEELSTILDAPLGTLKSRLHRARAKLRESLA